MKKSEPFCLLTKKNRHVSKKDDAARVRTTLDRQIISGMKEHFQNYVKVCNSGLYRSRSSVKRDHCRHQRRTRQRAGRSNRRKSSENTVLVNGMNAVNKQELFVEEVDAILRDVQNLEKDQRDLKSKLNQVQNKLKVRNEKVRKMLAQVRDNLLNDHKVVK